MAIALELVDLSGPDQHKASQSQKAWGLPVKSPSKVDVWGSWIGET